MFIEKCVVKDCEIIYTEDQCKNCPNQVFDDSITSTTYYPTNYREKTALKPAMGANERENYYGKYKN